MTVLPTGFHPGHAVSLRTRPPPILADALDPHTGEYLAIDEGRDPTDAAAITAVRTIRNSGSAVTDVGHRLIDHTHNDTKLPSFFESEGHQMLRRLIESGQVTLSELKVHAEPGNDFAELEVRFVNEVEKREQRQGLVDPLKGSFRTP